MKQKILWCCLLLTTLLPCMAQNWKELSEADRQYKAKLEELKKVSGANASRETTFPMIMNLIRNVLETEVPENVLQEIEKKFRTVFFENVLMLEMPIYQKYLSLSELDEYITFYRTPLGKKVASITPQLSKDLMQAGAVAGQQVVSSILQELQERGYKVKDM